MAKGFKPRGTWISPFEPNFPEVDLVFGIFPWNVQEVQGLIDKKLSQTEGGQNAGEAKGISAHRSKSNCEGEYREKGKGGEERVKGKVKEAGESLSLSHSFSHSLFFALS